MNVICTKPGPQIRRSPRSFIVAKADTVCGRFLIKEMNGTRVALVHVFAEDGPLPKNSG
jgi:hypothetical protein